VGVDDLEGVEANRIRLGLFLPSQSDGRRDRELLPGSFGMRRMLSHIIGTRSMTNIWLHGRFRRGAGPKRSQRSHFLSRACQLVTIVMASDFSAATVEIRNRFPSALASH
jgi:hypothetical protein